MNFEIHTSSPEPIYRQIVGQIKLAVALGRLAPDDPLPSVRELAQRLVVNPNTVFRAYLELEREGVVYTKRGVGTFVAEWRDMLSLEEKRRILGEALDRVLTEAVHLGITERELVELMRERACSFNLRSAPPVKEKK